MHHVALDRPWPDDRHLDDEVVEDARLQPWQHAHLRPALDLEDADRIGAADHVVNVLLVILEELMQGFPLAVMPVEQLEGPGDAGEHAERQHVDLQDLQRVEIVLVPLDHVAVWHRRVHDRHDLVEPVAGDDETADMLGEVAREAHQLRGIIEHPDSRRVLRIETGSLRLALGKIGHRPAPDRAGERRLHVLGKAEGLGGLAAGRARPVADDGRRQPRMLPAVGAVDMLDHLFPLLVLEIDVDIRRLVPLGREEAIEEQGGRKRVDLGNAQAIADGGVRRRTAPLAEDFGAARKLHDIAHRQEVGLVALAGDQLELVFDLLGNLLRNAVGIALVRTLHRQSPQSLCRCLARSAFVRILIFELRQRELQPPKKMPGIGDRFRVITEDARHFGRRLQMPFGIGVQPIAGRGDCHMLADGGDDIGKRPAVGGMKQRTVGGDDLHRRMAGDGRKPGKGKLIEAVITRYQRQIEPTREMRVQAFEKIGKQGCLRRADHRVRHHREQQVLAPLDEIGFIERAGALLGAQVSSTQHPAEIAPAAAIAGIGKHVGQIFRKGEPRAGLEGVFLHLGLRMRAHHTGNRIAVGNAKAANVKTARRNHHLARMRRAFEEGEIRPGADLEIGDSVAHAKTPCMNQRGGALAP
ncbi:hypothetical protein D9M72_353980 [compost metagenome]